MQWEPPRFPPTVTFMEVIIPTTLNGNANQNINPSIVTYKMEFSTTGKQQVILFCLKEVMPILEKSLHGPAQVKRGWFTTMVE